MIGRKNLHARERALRVAVGLAAAAGGLWIWPGAWPGYLVAASGVAFAGTGVFGFCPAWAMIGRASVRPASPDQRKARSG